MEKSKLINRENIVNYLLETGLLHRCIECQFKKMGNLEFMDDFEQDAWMWLLEYDENKLVDAFTNHHINALITRFIQNNIFSANSPYYKKYSKYYQYTTELVFEDDNNDDNNYDE